MACHVVVTLKPTDSAQRIIGAVEEPFLRGDEVLHLPLTGSVAERGFDTNVGQELAIQGLVPPQTAVELLILAAAVYIADKRILRAASFDRWTRDFIVYLPVSDVDKWRPIVADIEEALAYLSGDRWQIRIRKDGTSLPSSINGQQPEQQVEADCVCLFSGGLDSCIGAIDLLSTDHSPLLIGHYDDGQTPAYQVRVHKYLATEYGNERCQLLQIRMRPQTASAHEYEDTTRSRSFLFIALGVLAATSLGPETTLFIPENGLISLNVPMTPSRLGSLSTRTTHPYFMSLLQRILDALDLNVPLVNPYRFSTKGEMIQACRNRELIHTVGPETMSCAHPSVGRWVGRPPKHCGYCLPCLIRRAAMHQAGLDDPKHYDWDVLTQRLSRTRGSTLRAMQIALHRRQQHVRLSEILKSGPLVTREAGDLQRYIDVYRRGMQELDAILAPGNVQWGG